MLGSLVLLHKSQVVVDSWIGNLSKREHDLLVVVLRDGYFRAKGCLGASLVPGSPSQLESGIAVARPGLAAFVARNVAEPARPQFDVVIKWEGGGGKRGG